MNYTLMTADQPTHLKVVVSLIAGILIVVGILATV